MAIVNTHSKFSSWNEILTVPVTTPLPGRTALMTSSRPLPHRYVTAALSSFGTCINSLGRNFQLQIKLDSSYDSYARTGIRVRSFRWIESVKPSFAEFRWFFCLSASAKSRRRAPLMRICAFQRVHCLEHKRRYWRFRWTLPAFRSCHNGHFRPLHQPSSDAFWCL